MPKRIPPAPARTSITSGRGCVRSTAKSEGREDPGRGGASPSASLGRDDPGDACGSSSTAAALRRPLPLAPMTETAASSSASSAPGGAGGSAPGGAGGLRGGSQRRTAAKAIKAKTTPTSEGARAGKREPSAP